MCALSFSLSLVAHIGMVESYNEMIPAARVQCEQVVSGIYLNSEENLSAYVAYKFEHENVWAELGGVTGYGDGAMPFIRAGFDFNDGASIFVAPALENKHNGEQRVGAVIGIEWRF